MEHELQKPFRIGIVGGMGPMTDVLLQELIHAATPVERDQDYIPVICFTNPQIPDRTESLRRDGGASFVAAIAETARAVEAAGASVIVVPCNTAHARIAEIQAAVRIPVIDMIDGVVTHVSRQYPAFLSVGVLATSGARDARVYDQFLAREHRTVIYPEGRDQHHLMELIYEVKGAKRTPAHLSTLRLIMESMEKQGAELFILGCTELSLLWEDVRVSSVPVVDPLRIVAETLVCIAREKLSVPLTVARAYGRLAAG